MEGGPIKNLSFRSQRRGNVGTQEIHNITGHFTCTSANVIYCITCTCCKKLYIGENRKTTRRSIPRTPSRRRKESKPVARHFNFPNNCTQHITVCSISLHLKAVRKAAKPCSKNYILQIGTLNPHGINERFSFY